MGHNTSTFPAGTVLTPVFECMHDELGRIAVVIEGSHNIEDEDFRAIDQTRYVVRVSEHGELSPLTDTDVADQIYQLSNSYLYMIDGDVVTSENQIVKINDEHFQLDVPDHGLIDIEPIGVIEVEEDGIENLYQLSIANPAPGIYLVILLEIIGANPLEFRAIALEDEELVDGIITEYLVQIGAIEADDEDAEDEESEEEEEEEEEEEDTDNSATPEDDTAVPGQHWTAVTDIEEA